MLKCLNLVHNYTIIQEKGCYNMRFKHKEAMCNRIAHQWQNLQYSMASAVLLQLYHSFN